MKKEIRVFDKMSIASESPKEGEVCAYVTKEQRQFFFVQEDSTREIYKCSFAENFEDHWFVDDLESDDIL